jgi:outer membrane protein OmpA-like peptidoglycan-associated protein
MQKKSMSKEYLNIADLMTGMMMVFLLIAVAFMLDVEASKKEIERQRDAMAEIALVAERSRLQLRQELLEEFEDNLEGWNAEILEDNTVRFNAPNVLFKTGKSTLRARFKTILNDFFPRYIKILRHYEQEIKAIRIEGHTSSDWLNAKKMTTRYLNNVELSQRRALATMKYCYGRTSVTDDGRDWLIKVLRANGLSFAQLILKSDKSEDAKKSRRVEFKVVTKAEEKLHQILELERSRSNQ